MANEFANAVMAEINAGLAVSDPGTKVTNSLPVTTLERADTNTPIEIEHAGSSVGAYQWGVSGDTVAAAGADAAGATALARQNNTVTGASGTNGVRLPYIDVFNYSCVHLVHNSDAANALIVYPDQTHPDTINGTTTFTIPAGCLAVFISTASFAWAACVISNGVLGARASADQAILALDVDVTGADTVDKAAINTNFTNLQTLVNEIRAALIANGTIKGAA